MTITLDATPVLFRIDKTDPRNPVAVFPAERETIPGDTSNRYSMTCYAHVGQHSSCSYEWYQRTRPARPDEYADLKRELESAPYNYRLHVYSRITASLRAELAKEFARGT